MSEDIMNQPSELAILKDRARIMGIAHSPNIGVETLRQKIAERMSETEGDNANPLESGENPKVVVKPGESKAARFSSYRRNKRLNALKLVRVRIQCMDPKKTNLPGEFFTIGNEVIGTVSRYVPFGDKTDDGWHIENIIYKMMKRRKFQQIRITKDAQGNKVVNRNLAREFSLEVLPPLTEKELARLAATQAAAGLFNEDPMAG